MNAWSPKPDLNRIIKNDIEIMSAKNNVQQNLGREIESEPKNS